MAKKNKINCKSTDCHDNIRSNFLLTRGVSFIQNWNVFGDRILKRSAVATGNLSDFFATLEQQEAGLAGKGSLLEAGYKFLGQLVGRATPKFYSFFWIVKVEPDVGVDERHRLAWAAPSKMQVDY